MIASASNETAAKAVPAAQNQHLRDLANCIRFLSMDAVQQAKSGHPGAPLVWLTLRLSCFATSCSLTLGPALD